MSATELSREKIVKEVNEWAKQNLLENERRPFPFDSTVTPEGRAELFRFKVPFVGLPFSAYHVSERIWYFRQELAPDAQRAKEIKPSESGPLTGELAEAITASWGFLATMAKNGDANAFEEMVRCSTKLVSDLNEIAKLNPKLAIPLASKLSEWSVLFGPHKDAQQNAETLIQNLQVGSKSPLNVNGRWRNSAAEKQPYRPIVGQYCFRMFDKLLARIANGDAIGLKRYVICDVRDGFCPFDRGLPMTEEERLSLLVKGWPKWIVDAVSLEPLSADNAEQWFSVGWLALKEVSGGCVSSINELKQLGESRASYRKRMKASERIQNSQREECIRERLKEAFLARFGSR